MLSYLPTARRRLDYQRKTLMVSPVPPIGYWPHGEPVGSGVALDVSGNNRHGAYTACALGQAGMGDGSTGAATDGSTSVINLYSAALNSAYNGQEVSIGFWGRISTAVWTDGAQHFIARFRVDASNSFDFYKKTTNNQIECDYIAGGTTKGVIFTTSGPTSFFHLCATATKSGDQMKLYFNGAQVGTTQTGLGTWAGALLSTATVLGAASTVPASPIAATFAHATIWPLALPPGAIAELYATGLSGL